jgi:hypothetical protein
MSRKVRFGFLAVTALAAATATGYALAAVAPNLVPAGTTRYAMAVGQDSQTSTSTTYVNIPNLSVGFSIPSGRSADLMITFSGEVNSCTPIEARAVIDGVAALPSETQLFWPDNIGAQSQGFTFWRRNVPAGLHTVAMQWHGLTSCSQQFISNRSMVVTANIH